MKPAQLIWLGRLLFIVALLTQLWRTDHYATYSGSDRNQQLVATQQMMEGHPFSVPTAKKDQLDQVEQVPLQGWPPGYRVVIEGLYRLTGNWVLADRLFNALGVLWVFCGAHLLLWNLRNYVSKWVYPSFFAFWIVSFTPFHYTVGVEEWALASFLLASWLILTKTRSMLTLGLILLISFGVLFRYLYLPLFLLPVFVWWHAYQLDRLPFKRLALNLVSLTVPVLLLVYALKPAYTLGGHWWDTFVPERWYPAHLLKMDAFPLKAWAYFGLEGTMNKWPDLPAILPFLMKAILLLGSLFILYSLYQGFRSRETDAFKSLQFAWWGAALGTVALLVFQSLARAPEFHNVVYHWTYVQETRYYASLMVMIQICGLVRVFSARIPNWEKWAWRLLLVGAFSYGTIHSLYRAMDQTGRETRWANSEQWLKQSFDEVQSRTSQGEQIVWVYGASLYEEDEAHLAALAGASILMREHFVVSEVNQAITLMASCEGSDCEGFEYWTVLSREGERKRLMKKLPF